MRRLLFVCLLFISIFSYGESLTPVSIELKWFHQFQFAGVYAAKEKGFYRDEGLDVKIIERDPKSSPIQDVLSGKVDFGISDATLIRDKLLGKHVVLLAAIFQHSPLVLISLGKNNYLSPLELRGKRVMYQINVDDAVIVGMFNEFGMTKKDYVPVEHNFKDDALLNSNVDAMSSYISNQPYFYKKMGVPINIIKPESYGIDFYGDLLFVSEKYFKAHKDTALAFRRATLRGWDYALNHPGEVIQWLKTKYISKKSKEALEYEADVTKRLISAGSVPIGTINKKRLDNIAKTYIKNNEALKSGSVSGLSYTDYIYSEEDYKQIALIIFLALVILCFTVLLLIYINRQLKKRVVDKTSEISQATRRLENYVSIIDKGVLLANINSKGDILSVSDALKTTLGFADGVLQGKNIFTDTEIIVINKSDKDSALKALQYNKTAHGECRAKDSKATDHNFEFDIFASEDTAEDVFYIMFTDITDKRDIESLSVTDSLTKIPNRYALNNMLSDAWLQANSDTNPLSLIAVDIDHFKEVNDEYGHAVGDFVLKRVAHALNSSIRGDVVAGRWGGEEFLVICKNTDLDEAEAVAERLRAQVALVEIQDGETITASFGVATLRKEESIEALFERADQALYQAKESGRNRVCRSES